MRDSLVENEREKQMNTEPVAPVRDISELQNNIGWFIGLGFGLMILGFLALLLPLVATFAIEAVIGILFAIGGIMLLIHAVRWRKSINFANELLIGIVHLIAGMLLLIYPVAGVLTLTLLLTVFFIASGIFKIILGFSMKPASRWGWIIFSGLITLMLGVLLWAGLPVTAFWAPGFIVGIDLFFTGLSILMISWAIRGKVVKGEVYCIWGQCYSA